MQKLGFQNIWSFMKTLTPDPVLWRGLFHYRPVGDFPQASPPLPGDPGSVRGRRARGHGRIRPPRRTHDMRRF